MDTDGACPLNRSSPSRLNSGTQRTDFFHGLLRILELNNNSLAPLPAGVFSGLTALQILELAWTEQGTLHEDVFSGLPALEILDLDYNNLTSLPAGVFSGISPSLPCAAKGAIPQRVRTPPGNCRSSR